jgi:hypothetical protein
MDNKELLIHWITERWAIKENKDRGCPKPWTKDPVLQQIYMCNVRREDDKVTKWIRKNLSPAEVGSTNYEFVMILARFINWPDTLEVLKDPWIRARPSEDEGWEPWAATVKEQLDRLALSGRKVWGNAYVITTHGVRMGKAQYLVDNVLQAAFKARRALSEYPAGTQLGAKYAQLQRLEGLGSFLAAQVIADLKNTPGHPLSHAPDWWTFVAPGPGSVRGASWFHFGESGRVTYATFPQYFQGVRAYVDANWPSHIPQICNQDLQNCLCEFDKYMRVKNGTGRSKRKYPGTG